MGPWGAIIGAVTGFATSIKTLVEAYDHLNTAREELENAAEKAKESNLKRA
jgi:hypothetical protein